MSHFNLNNGMPRKRYIGPTHGLPCRPGTASLENLGGRIIIENEMHNHKLRLKQIKPSIDSSKPWAHSYQDTKLRKLSPTRDGRESPGHDAASLPPATRAGRSQSQQPRNGTSMSSTYPTKGPNASSKSAAPGSPPSPTSTRPAFDVTALTSDQQGTYKSLVQLLSTLPQKEAKSLLEQAYREGEERKLLMAYTGAFPEATKSSTTSRPQSSRPRDDSAAVAHHNTTVASSVASSARKPATASSAAASTGNTTPRSSAPTKSQQPKSPIGSVSPKSSTSNSRASSPRDSPKKVSASSPHGSKKGDGYDSFEEDDQ